MTFTRAATKPEWFFSDVITITSQTGVGSSTTLKLMRTALSNDGRKRFISGGAIMRSFAESRGMTIYDFAAYNAKHPDQGYDLKCDTEIRGYGSQNHTVIEGRLPHVFAPHGYHVKLVCPTDVRAGRRKKDKEYGHLPVGEIITMIEQRDSDDDGRYEVLYPGCLWPDKDFDIVLDTSTSNAAQVVNSILKEHDLWVRALGTNVRYTIAGES